MNEDFNKKLKEQINKSGYPLELDIVERLRLLEYTVLPNISYINRENKIHEIDAIALTHNIVEPKEWPYGTVSLDLILECKVSKERPWVFFRDPDPNFIHMINGLVGNLKYITDIDSKDGLLVGCMNTELRYHHYNSSIPICRTYLEAFGSDAGNNIYKAIQNTWDSIDFFKTFLYNQRATEIKASKARTIFLHGVIVFRGNMLVATKTKEDFKLEEIPHLLLRTMDCRTNGNNPFDPQNETIIDVIREDYLEEYLTICKNDHSLCLDHLVHIYKAGGLI